MSDNLVKRLREHVIHLDAWGKEANHDADIVEEAADRIEQLEAALREIAAGYETGWSTSTMGNMLDVAEILSERINIARKALEGKDETIG